LPPLGYEPEDRSVRIAPEQSALVRWIYERHLALGNVRQVAEELGRSG
jgi:pantothenate kinase